MSPSHVIAPSTEQSQGLRGLISAVKQHRFFGEWAMRGRLKDELEQLDIKRSRTSDLPVWILVTLLAVAAGSATIGALTHELDPQTAVGLAAAVLTVAGLLVAVLQWRAGLSEKAFDALYGRIKMANDMWLQAFKEMECESESELAEKRPEHLQVLGLHGDRQPGVHGQALPVRSRDEQATSSAAPSGISRLGATPSCSVAPLRSAPAKSRDTSLRRRRWFTRS